MSKMTVTFGGSGAPPKCKPNPAYPEGIDLSVAQPGEDACAVKLQYPAKGIGYWLIECRCGAKVTCTTAGRPDDPRSIKVPCKPMVVGESAQ